MKDAGCSIGITSIFMFSWHILSPKKENKKGEK
jgi:hypothetical protein